MPERNETSGKTTELPPLDVTKEDLRRAEEYCDKYMAGQGRTLVSIKAKEFCRERQLSETLATLRKVEAERDALKVLAIARYVSMSYDFPGDAPIECGMWCDICKEHVSDDKLAGHLPTCILARSESAGGGK